MVDILNPGKVKEFRGDLVPERIKMLEKKRRAEAMERKERERRIREQIEAMAKQAQEEAAAQKQKDEEKRRQIQQAREDAVYNATMSAANASKEDSNKVTDDDYDEDEEEDEGDLESEGVKPEFSATKESEVTTPSSDVKPDAMITKLSRGESLSQSGGFVQPEKMINIFEKKMNPVVEALSSLVQQFVPVESQHFDLEKYSAKLKADLETRYKVEETWSSDYFSLTCPAVKFSDRFLVYGEFFTDKN